MTTKYIDSGELVEVLGLQVSNMDSREAVRKYIVEELLSIVSPPRNKNKQTRRIRLWLKEFISNPNCIGVSRNYIQVWKAIQHIQDNDSFLQLVAANIYLMWD